MSAPSADKTAILAYAIAHQACICNCTVCRGSEAEDSKRGFIEDAHCHSKKGGCYVPAIKKPVKLHIAIARRTK